MTAYSPKAKRVAARMATGGGMRCVRTSSCVVKCPPESRCEIAKATPRENVHCAVRSAVYTKPLSGLSPRRWHARPLFAHARPAIKKRKSCDCAASFTLREKCVISSTWPQLGLCRHRGRQSSAALRPSRRCCRCCCPGPFHCAAPQQPPRARIITGTRCPSFSGRTRT